MTLGTELLNEDIGGLELFISTYGIQIAEKSWEGRKETCFFKMLPGICLPASSNAVAHSAATRSPIHWFV